MPWKQNLIKALKITKENVHGRTNKRINSPGLVLAVFWFYHAMASFPKTLHLSIKKFTLELRRLLSLKVYKI